MLVTPFGIVTLERLEQEENALSLMLVTFLPSIVPGIASLLSLPV